MATNRIRRYDSDGIEVQYELSRCIHAAECVRRLNQVFNSEQRPWIQPQNASADEIATTISHCPTGALHYTRKDDGASEAVPARNTLRIVPDGPHYLRGDLEFVRDGGETYLEETRAALCRCGASQNKPFCDNSHKALEFTDPGTASEPAGEASGVGGRLRITPQVDGPVEILGNLEIQDAAGRILHRNETYLCRCGGSTNKPFCDGTHRSRGFQAD